MTAGSRWTRHGPRACALLLEDEMTGGFANILSAQTMFPVLSQDEMAGHYSENEVSLAVRMGRITGEGGAWDRISQRVAAIDAYRTQFETVYPEIGAGRAIAFDRHLERHRRLHCVRVAFRQGAVRCDAAR
ncbi:MAG: hypothetical protein ACN6I5_00125 [Hyphomicrobiales bacterium]